MSWFGGWGGGNKGGNDKGAAEKGAYDDHGFDESPDFAAPSGSFGGSAGGTGSLESELMMEQQKALVQAIMFKLTETSFAACVTKPSSSLSSSEQNCISAVVTKYLDASEFVVKRMQK